MKNINEKISSYWDNAENSSTLDQLLLPIKEEIGAKYENYKNDITKETKQSLESILTYDQLAIKLWGEKLTGIQKENYQKTMDFINTLPKEVRKNTDIIYENDKITLITLEPYVLQVTTQWETINNDFLKIPDTITTDNEVVLDFNDITSIDASGTSISAHTNYDNFYIEITNPNETPTNNTFDIWAVERLQWRKILEDIINNSESFDQLSIEDKLELLRGFYPNERVDSLPTYDEEIINNILWWLYYDIDEFDLDDYLGPILDNKNI